MGSPLVLAAGMLMGWGVLPLHGMQAPPLPPVPAPVAVPELGALPAPMPAPMTAVDTVEALYRQARTALNERRYLAAAEMFSRIRDEYRDSQYTGDSYYFEALARSRMESVAQLNRAREVLAQQLQSHPRSATIDEARALMARLDSDLARRGNVQAARRIEEQAQRSQREMARLRSELVAEQRRATGELHAAQAELQAAQFEQMAQAAAMRGDRRSAEQEACEVEGEIRAIALNALAEMDPAQVDPLLRDVVLDDNPCNRQLREMAMMILGRRVDDGDSGAMDILIQLATQSADTLSQAREMAFFMLAESQSERAFDALRSMAAAGELTAELEQAYIWSMVRSGRPEAADLLTTRLRSGETSPEARQALVFALAEMGDTGRLFSLYDELDDPGLRVAVVWTAARNGGAATRDWLLARVMDGQEDIEVRTAALFRAADEGLSPARILEVYSSADDIELRRQALMALLHAGPSEAGDAEVDALIQITRSEEDPELRQAALASLSQIESPRVAAFLAELLRGGGGD